MDGGSSKLNSAVTVQQLYNVCECNKCQQVMATYSRYGWIPSSFLKNEASPAQITTVWQENAVLGRWVGLQFLGTQKGASHPPSSWSCEKQSKKDSSFTDMFWLKQFVCNLWRHNLHNWNGFVFHWHVLIKATCMQLMKTHFASWNDTWLQRLRPKSQTTFYFWIFLQRSKKTSTKLLPNFCWMFFCPRNKVLSQVTGDGIFLSPC